MARGRQLLPHFLGGAKRCGTREQFEIFSACICLTQEQEWYLIKKKKEKPSPLTVGLNPTLFRHWAHTQVRKPLSTTYKWPPNQSHLFTDAHGHPHLSFPDGAARLGELVPSPGHFLTRFPPQMESYLLWCPHLRCFQTEKHLSSLQNDTCCWNINCKLSVVCCLSRKF